MRTPCLSTGDGLQLWGNSKCQHANRRGEGQESERNAETLHNMASKDISSTVIPRFLQSPDEGQMPTHHPCLPGTLCVQPEAHYKPFTIFMVGKAQMSCVLTVCGDLVVLLSQWSKTMQGVLRLAYWGTMICVFNE